MARRPGPSFRALLFRSGEGAVCEPSRLEDRQLRELVFLSVQKATLGTGGRGPQARPGPSFRALLFRSGEGAVCEPLRLEDRQLRELVFLSVQKATVRHWGPRPAGPVRPSGPCCFGLAKAPFVSLCGWKTDSSES